MTILLGVVGLFVAIALHELGHLLPGLALGQRFMVFAVGPLLVEAEPGGRPRLSWNRDVSLYGGIACTLPNQVEHVREHMATIVAGGPIASLLLAGAAAASLAWLPLPKGALRSELQWLRLLSAALFVGSALPLANGPFVTGGMRFLRLLDRGPVGQRETSMLALTAAEQGGVRPRDWDFALIEQGLAVRDGSMFEMQMHLFAYLRAFDADDLAHARATLAAAVALQDCLPRTVTGSCLVEWAFFEPLRGEGAAGARRILERIPRHSLGVTSADRLRVQAAIACAERDPLAAGAVECALAAWPSPGEKDTRFPEKHPESARYSVCPQCMIAASIARVDDVRFRTSTSG